MKTKALFLNSIVLSAVIVMSLTFSPVARAQAVILTPPCTSLSQNLFWGEFDATTGGQVTTLQTFLYDEGYLFHVPTGYFGPLTYAAAVRFQSANGVPSTGFVGPITRAEIQALSCNNIPPPPQKIPVIESINPNAGPVGTTVTLTGFGFTPNDNTVYFDGGATPHVSATPGIAIACTTDPNCVGGIQYSLTFTIPSSVGPYCPPGAPCPLYLRLVTPGTYPLYITNANGMSNQVNFTVTDASSNIAPSINGIDGPNSIPLGTPGNWTVRVSAGQNTNLHYSVNWGDQSPMPATLMMPSMGNVQSSATFSHTYQYAGTYQPVFMVTNDAGQTATASATVVVTPLY